MTVIQLPFVLNSELIYYSAEDNNYYIYRCTVSLYETSSHVKKRPPSAVIIIYFCIVFVLRRPFSYYVIDHAPRASRSTRSGRSLTTSSTTHLTRHEALDRVSQHDGEGEHESSDVDEIVRFAIVLQNVAYWQTITKIYDLFRSTAAISPIATI